MSLTDFCAGLLPCNDSCPHALFEPVIAAAHQAGFDYCSFGIRLPFPMTRPRVEMFNNYSAEWRHRYASEHYLEVDPSVAYASKNTKPILWSNEMFGAAPAFWSEARDAGLRHGWVHPTSETSGIAGMLTLARSHDPITASELKSLETKLSWLAHAVHHMFAKSLVERCNPAHDVPLTAREVEILRWTADGKTADQISDILCISDHTVNFHVKNAIVKLRSSNKTSAVVRAAMMGLLS